MKCNRSGHGTMVVEKGENIEMTEFNRAPATDHTPAFETCVIFTLVF